MWHKKKEILVSRLFSSPYRVGSLRQYYEIMKRQKQRKKEISKGKEATSPETKFSVRNGRNRGVGCTLWLRLCCCFCLLAPASACQENWADFATISVPWNHADFVQISDLCEKKSLPDFEMISGNGKQNNALTGHPGMAKTHTNGPQDKPGDANGQAMSAAGRRRVRCSSVLPLAPASRYWKMLRLRLKATCELAGLRLRQLGAGVDAWLLRSPLVLMWVGLGLLGELFCKVMIPTWNQLLKRNGAWPQPCQRCLCETRGRKARLVGPQRVCGIKGARGLGGCFRAAPLKSMGFSDAVRIRKCVHLIRKSWDIRVPTQPEVEIQGVRQWSGPQIEQVPTTTNRHSECHHGQLDNTVVKDVTGVFGSVV